MSRPESSAEQKAQGYALGQIVQQLRLPRTSEWLANAAGVSVDTLRRIESGKVGSPGVFLVARLSGALGVTMDELLRLVSKQVKRKETN